MTWKWANIYKCNDISVALFTTEMTIIKSLSLMLKKKISEPGARDQTTNLCSLTSPQQQLHYDHQLRITTLGIQSPNTKHGTNPMQGRSKT